MVMMVIGLRGKKEMKNKYRLTDYFMGMDKDDIVELNEKEALMLKKYHY